MSGRTAVVRDGAGGVPLAGQLVVAGGGVVLDDASLEQLAEDVAARQGAPTTRRTYGAVYRSLLMFLAEHAGAGAGPVPVEAFSARAVMRWRESLERAGRSPSTIAVYLSAVRHLAAELDVDIDRVKAGKVRRGQPRELNDGELARLLKQPDRRTRIGKRDLAMLLLMADAGLRREEVAALEPGQFEERRRHASPALRRAVRGSTALAVRIRGKGGVERIVPLTAAAVEAVEAWFASRPPAATDHVFVTLPRGARTPGPLSANAIYRRVVRHAEAAGVRRDRMTPHVLRHTFASRCRAQGAPVEVIRDLLGHSDIATTMIYTRVDHQALEHAVDALESTGGPFRRHAAG
ncbi:tyrosine-type recombinase/integrase [Patulibacter sp. S7RM1-6]